MSDLENPLPHDPYSPHPPNSPLHALPHHLPGATLDSQHQPPHRAYPTHADPAPTPHVDHAPRYTGAPRGLYERRRPPAGTASMLSLEGWGGEGCSPASLDAVGRQGAGRGGGLAGSPQAGTPGTEGGGEGGADVVAGGKHGDARGGSDGNGHTRGSGGNGHTVRESAGVESGAAPHLCALYGDMTLPPKLQPTTSL